MTTEDTPIAGPLNNVIRIDDERIKGHLDQVVRGTVEETLNSLLDAEADRLSNAQRHERTEALRDPRAGHYERSLETKAGEVTLKVPKLRRQTFETAIIDRSDDEKLADAAASLSAGGRRRSRRR
jgi:transposase-like protein